MLCYVLLTHTEYSAYKLPTWIVYDLIIVLPNCIIITMKTIVKADKNISQFSEWGTNSDNIRKWKHSHAKSLFVIQSLM